MTRKMSHLITILLTEQFLLQKSINNFSFEEQDVVTDVSVKLQPPCLCHLRGINMGLHAKLFLNLGETLIHNEKLHSPQSW